MLYLFRINCVAIPMDSLHMLHVVIMDHMIKMGFEDTALTFARETAINFPPHPASLPPGFKGFEQMSGFLAEWWNIFFDIYTRMDHKISENGEELAESSAQAEARARVQAQAQVHNGSINTPAMAYTEARAQACYQATALPLDQRQAQAMAYAESPAPGHAGSQTLPLPLAQAQAQSWSFANNGVATPNHYIHPMGPSSVQQHPALLLDQAQVQPWTFANNGVATPEQYIHSMGMGPSSLQQHPYFANNTNIASQAVSGVRWTDEQSSAQNSRQVRRRVN